MSLEKSPFSAAIMAAAAVSSAAFMMILLGYLRTVTFGVGSAGTGAGPSLAGFAWGPVLAGLLITLTFPFLVVWYVINRLNKAHYGRQGLVRWVLVGMVWALLLNIVIQVTTPLLPAEGEGSSGFVGVLIWGTQIAMIPLSYYLVFRVFSTWQGRHGRRI